MNNKAKKIMNEQENIVKETIAGYCRFQQDRIHQIPGTQVLVRNELDAGKVGIVMGYGAGTGCHRLYGEKLYGCPSDRRTFRGAGTAAYL